MKSINCYEQKYEKMLVFSNSCARTTRINNSFQFYIIPGFSF